MKIKLLQIGKTNESYLQQGIEIYSKRLQHYCKFENQILADIKNAGNLSVEELQKKEGEVLLKTLDKDCTVLLDEGGQQFSSVEFAMWLQKRMNERPAISFVIGGAFGFCPSVKQAADFKISLSALTFSHQMVRLIAVEQIYRAFTILKNESYHHI